MVRRRLSKADYDLAVDLVRRGVYVCDVAKKLGVHPKTVSRALRRGGPPSGQYPARPTIIDPYKDLANRLHSRGDLSGGEIFRRLRAAGYRGSATTVRRYLRLRRKRRSK
jgi:IS30 family transposase